MTNYPPPGDQPGWSNPPPNPPPPGYGGSYGNQGGYGGPPPKNGIGIAAMVVGIVALFLFWIPFLGVIVAIVGLVLGIVGIRKASRGEATNKGMAIAGVATGGLALVGSLLITIFVFAAVDEFGNFFECIEQAQTVEEEQQCSTQFEDNFTQ